MNENTAQINFSHLPNEILETIALHLHRRDLFSLSLTDQNISKVFTSCLWRAVHISDERRRKSVREALRARPTLAQTVLELELCCIEEQQEGQEDVKLYSDLEFAASLPNLQHLSVHTGTRDEDRERSTEAAQALGKLRHLKSCELRYHHPNGENWTKNDLPALFSLLQHPSMREVCLIHFDSKAGVTTDPMPDGAALTKLSLLNCDVNARALGQLTRNCKPRQLEYCYWQADSYPPIETGLDDAQEYIDALGDAKETSMSQLTYYRDFERDEEVPLRFERVEPLQHLATTIFALCGADLPERESEGPIRLSLPPQLQVLEVLIFENFDWEDEFQPFLRALIAYQESKERSKLQELRFRTRSSTCLDKTEWEEIHKTGARCGLAVTMGLLPPEWDE